MRGRGEGEIDVAGGFVVDEGGGADAEVGADLRDVAGSGLRRLVGRRSESESDSSSSDSSDVDSAEDDTTAEEAAAAEDLAETPIILTVGCSCFNLDSGLAG